jgi:hypothetical protein
MVQQPTTKSKRRGKLRKDAILLHENTPIQCRDFHTFGPMKEALRGIVFQSDEEVIGAVKNWLKTQPKNLFF